MHNNNVQLHTERERTPHEPRKLESDLIQLKEEHEDLKHRFEKLKKQLELWNQVSQGSCSSQLSK